MSAALRSWPLTWLPFADSGPSWPAIRLKDLFLIDRGSALVCDVLKVNIGALSWRQAGLLLPVLQLLAQLQKILVGLILRDLILDRPNARGIRQRILRVQHNRM